MFGLLRGWRRRRLLRTPAPAEWNTILDANVPFVHQLRPELRGRLFDDVRIFVDEKHFIAAGGMVIDDLVRVVIAAAAVRLTLHLGIDVYNRLTEIIVYPSHYHHGDKDTVIFGEAHDWGTVVLSWDAVLQGLTNPRDGHDTATHEFAHVLDRADGSFDGAPELRAGEHYRAWARVMSTHYERLQRGQRTERRVLRDYGATNEAEFFAVATESFFEKPRAMKQHTPELYQELSQFYGFDPAD